MKVWRLVEFGKSGSQGVTSRELRAAIGLSRERLETAYEFLLEHPPLGLAVQRHGDELFLVTSPEGQLIDRAAFEKTAAGCAVQGGAGGAGDRRLPAAHRAGRYRADPRLGQRQRVGHDARTQPDRAQRAQLLVTTRAFLDHAGLRDLADLPLLSELDSSSADPGFTAE
jgi:hypothetical protein